MHTAEHLAEDSEPSYLAVARMYDNCVSPDGVLHYISSPTLKAADAALAKLLGILYDHVDEPFASSAYQQIRNLRWDLLSTTRLPRDLLSEKMEIIEQVKGAQWMGIPEKVLRDLSNAIAGLEALDANPLLQAILDTIADEKWAMEIEQVQVIAYGKSAYAANRRMQETTESLAAVDRAEISVTTLRNLRRDRPACEHAIYLGSPRAYDQSVVTCPVAEFSHFLFYDFMRVDYANGGWPHSFIGFVSDLPQPHWMNFERIRHWPIEEEQVEEITVADEEVSQHEIVEEELYPRLKFKQRIATATEVADGPEEPLEPCACVLLEEDCWAAIPAQIRTLRRDDGVWEASWIDPEDMEAGDLILLLQEEPQNLAAETAGEVAHSHGRGFELWRSVQQIIREEIAQRGWASVHRELVSLGIKTPHAYWFDDGRLGPMRRASFLALSSAAGLSDAEGLEAHEAVRAWQSYRVQAGFQVSELFSDEALKLLSQLDINGDPIEDMAEGIISVSLHDLKFGKYAVCRVVGFLGQAYIPGSRCRRILDSRGVPWLG